MTAQDHSHLADNAKPRQYPAVRRKLVIFLIAFELIVLAIALGVKYALTGVAVRDTLGAALLAVTIILSIVTPIVMFRRS